MPLQAFLSSFLLLRQQMSVCYQCGRGIYEAMIKFPWFSHQNTEIQTVLHKMKTKVLVDRIDGEGTQGRERLT